MSSERHGRRVPRRAVRALVRPLARVAGADVVLQRRAAHEAALWGEKVKT